MLTASLQSIASIFKHQDIYSRAAPVPAAMQWTDHATFSSIRTATYPVCSGVVAEGDSSHNQDLPGGSATPAHIQGAGGPYEGAARLELLLRGVKRNKPTKHNARLPIIPVILRIILMQAGSRSHKRGQHHVLGSLLSGVCSLFKVRRVHRATRGIG